MIRVLGMFLVISASGIGSMLFGLDPTSWVIGALTAAIAIPVTFTLALVVSGYFDEPWGRWHTHDYYRLRTFLGRHVWKGFHWRQEDEPITCVICKRPFYRWEWSEAQIKDPTFRAKYYNHVLVDGIYRLPCPEDAVKLAESK